MKEEHFKDSCVDSLHIWSPHRISAFICICGVLELLWKKTVCTQPLDELSSKSCWNYNILLNVFGQTFSSCSLTIYLQVCCVCSAHLIQLCLGFDQSSFQLHWKKKQN